jgi:hypothetical protein
MLIIFGNAPQGGIPPSLPDLHIKDSVTDVDVPVGGVEGWDADYLQAQTICFAPMVFEDEESGVSGESDSYWTRRLSRFLVHLEFSDSGASATIRVTRQDKNDVKTVSGQNTIQATSTQNGSAYIGELKEFETFGANKMSVIVESVSAGTVNLRCAGV